MTRSDLPFCLVFAGLAAATTGCRAASDRTGSESMSDSSEPTGRCADDRSWSNVGAGEYLTCGVHGDGCIECWGVEDYNEMHDTSRWVDYDDDEPPDGEYASVVLSLGEVEVGSWHACALDLAGAPTCWGRDNWDQASPPELFFTELALGGYFSCGLGGDGQISCWGRARADSGVPANVPSGAGYTAIAAGYDNACAIDENLDIQCWGDDGPTVLRTGTWTALAVFADMCAVGPYSPLECWTTFDDSNETFDGAPTETGYIDVCMGYDGNGCVLSSTGSVNCWGEEYVDYNPDTYLVTSALAFTQISCGSHHACGVTTDGAALCWGSNGEGQSAVPP